MRFPCLRASLYALNGMDCKDSSALATALILFLAVALKLRRRTPALRGAQRDDIAVVGAAAHGWLRLREFGSVLRPPPLTVFFFLEDDGSVRQFRPSRTGLWRPRGDRGGSTVVWPVGFPAVPCKWTGDGFHFTSTTRRETARARHPPPGRTQPTA